MPNVSNTPVAVASSKGLTRAIDSVSPDTGMVAWRKRGVTLENLLPGVYEEEEEEEEEEGFKK